MYTDKHQAIVKKGIDLANPATRLCRRVILVVLLAIMSGISATVSAECAKDEKPSFDMFQSMEPLFEDVSRRWGGQIIKGVLTSQAVGDLCLWVYEIKLLSSTGEVTDIVYDASELRMIGFNSPQVAADEPNVGVLRSIGQRFGFFGRRDPTSEGRGDSDRGDGSSTASSSDGGATDTDTTSDPSTDTDTADTTDDTDDTDDASGPATSADEGSGSTGQSGDSRGGSGGGTSGSSSNSSGATGNKGG